MSALLSINNYYYRRGGAETVFFNHNAMFAEAGWKVAPFSMQHPKNEPSPWSDYFIDELEFGHHYNAWRKARSAGKVIYSFEARRKLDSLLDAFRPDIAHAHNIYHHISPSILPLLKKRGVPVVLTLHDLKIACPAYQMLARDGVCERCRDGNLSHVIRQRCIKGSLALSSLIYLESTLHRRLGLYRDHVDRFVVPSRFYIDKFVEWGWDRDRFVHIPNVVDAGGFEPDFNPGDHFVFFGRLSREKGILTLIRAAAAAGVPLQVIGTGPDEGECRAVAESSGGRVEFLGYRSGSELHRLIAAARAVALPSEWYENAPMSVLEAYALGKPVLGADIGGIPELIRAGETGAVFRSGDVVSLSEQLSRFAGMDDESVADMGREGRAWVADRFSRSGYMERTVALYRELGVS